MEISKVITSKDFMETFHTFNKKIFDDEKFSKYQYVLTSVSITDCNIKDIDICIQGDINQYSQAYLVMANRVLSEYKMYNDKAYLHLKDIISVTSFENIELLEISFGDFVSSGYVKKGFTISYIYNPMPEDMYQTLIYNIYFEFNENHKLFYVVGNSTDFIF